jgi:hypothetical protein
MKSGNVPAQRSLCLTPTVAFQGHQYIVQAHNSKMQLDFGSANNSIAEYHELHGMVVRNSEHSHLLALQIHPQGPLAVATVQ